MSKRILVVASEPDIRKMLKLVLTKRGYSVDEACDGRDALRQLERSTYSGMLLDVYMPVMNGIETLAQARKLYPTLPIVMMTGWSKTELHTQLLAGGAKEVLLYPIESLRLIQVVERWFQIEYASFLMYFFVHMARRFMSRVKNLWPMSFGASMDKTGTVVIAPQLTAESLIRSPLGWVEEEYVRAVPVKVALRGLVRIFEEYSHTKYIDSRGLDAVGEAFARAQVVEAPATAIAWMESEETPARREVVGCFLREYYRDVSATDSAVATLLAAAARCEPGTQGYGALISALAAANASVGDAAADEFLKRLERG